MRFLNSPSGSYLSVRAFQSAGRRVLKKLITFFELRFWAALHFEQSLLIASGNSPEKSNKKKREKFKNGSDLVLRMQF